MEQLLPFLQDYGFPVVITFYLLHRIEVKLDTLNQSILMLSERMAEPTYATDLNTKKTV